MTAHTTPPAGRRHSATRTSHAPDRSQGARAAGKRADRHPARNTRSRVNMRHAAQPLAHVAGHVSLLIFLETIAKIIIDKTPLLTLLSLH
jgi:hypothetical protein